MIDHTPNASILIDDEEYQERLEIIAGDEPDEPFFSHPFGVDDYAV